MAEIVLYLITLACLASIIKEAFISSDKYGEEREKYKSMLYDREDKLSTPDYSQKYIENANLNMKIDKIIKERNEKRDSS